MSSVSSRVQQAYFEYLTMLEVSIRNAAITHDLDRSTLHRIVNCRRDANPDTMPSRPYEINAPVIRQGRSRAFK